MDTHANGGRRHDMSPQTDRRSRYGRRPTAERRPTLNDGPFSRRPPRRRRTTNRGVAFLINQTEEAATAASLLAARRAWPEVLRGKRLRRVGPRRVVRYQPEVAATGWP